MGEVEAEGTVEEVVIAGLEAFGGKIVEERVDFIEG